jgi:hypothetical protein
LPTGRLRRRSRQRRPSGISGSGPIGFVWNGHRPMLIEAQAALTAA